ncbi:hypothetical protein [Corynebacterium liangguodongii]|uniref:Uncharacterized protein n=1 Tax=Corynebacterium liangguodongii TaxID=2079535 RepID=A0A2S0WGM0_9CORY|nr:hypothetical protein [Corynebacterium liangguodongii]AWB84938.1 hypothetical protein C3E79_11040 [Corynebacterium liangguodongii]PWB99354.1 hypothetical protein DF219_07235 [Corynebacterium liangguodongii]
MSAKKTVLFLVLALVWVATPFMGDRVPQWAQVLYWVALVLASVTGVVLAVRSRSVLLGVVSLLTLFAWPIVLAVSLAAGGMG